MSSSCHALTACSDEGSDEGSLRCGTGTSMALSVHLDASSTWVFAMLWWMLVLSSSGGAYLGALLAPMRAPLRCRHSSGLRLSELHQRVSARTGILTCPSQLTQKADLVTSADPRSGSSVMVLCMSGSCHAPRSRVEEATLRKQKANVRYSLSSRAQRQQEVR